MMRIAETINNEIVYRDMTPEEEAKYLEEQENIPQEVLSPEDRIAELERQLAAAKILLGVE